MKKFRRLGLGTAGLKTIAELLGRGTSGSGAQKRASRAARLAAIAGDGLGFDGQGFDGLGSGAHASGGMGIEQLEQRQLLFTLTITPDLVDPQTGLGTIISAPFAYHIPVFNAPQPTADGVEIPTISENFDDENAAWTMQIPAAPPSNTTFAESNIVLTYSGATPTPVVLGTRGGGGGQPDRFLNATLNTTDQLTFAFFTEAQGNQARAPRLALSAQIFIGNGADASPLKTTADGSRLELLRDGVVVATFSEATLVAISTTVIGGTRYDVALSDGFDSFRIRSAQDAPGNASYGDSFTVEAINAVFPSTRFSEAVDSRVFGGIISFTGPVGASAQVLDVYGRDMRLTLRGRIPEGAEQPDIDRNGDGIPEYNDGIGRIIITGTNDRSSFIITGGTIDTISQGTGINQNTEFGGDSGWKLVIPDDTAGILDDFEGVGMGFAVDAAGTAAVGLAPAGGSIIVGSPYVRDRTNANTYYGTAQTVNTARANNVDQGVSVTGTIGLVRVDGLLFGTSVVTGSARRFTAGALYGSVRVEGDLGEFVVTTEAGSWFNELQSGTPTNSHPVQPTGSRLFVGRTIRTISVGTRNTMDVEVLGDVNNPARAGLNLRDFYSMETMYVRPNQQQITGAYTIISGLRNGSDWSGQFGGRGSGVVSIGGWLRNDLVQGAEFVGYNGTSARIFASINDLDGVVNTVADLTDIYAFPADPTREIVISTLTGQGVQYAKVIDRDGKVIAAYDVGGFGRGSGGVRGGSAFMRFRPERADVYYLVVEGSGDPSGGGFARYSMQIDGMAPVVTGLFEVGGDAGAVRSGGFTTANQAQGNGGFVLSLSAGGVGLIRAGAGVVTSAGGLASAVASANTNQPDAVFSSLGAGSINVPGTLYSLFVGGDIRGTQITVGGDLGALVTGRQLPTGSFSELAGDMLAIDLRVAGRIGLIDVMGAMGADQDAAPDFRSGNVIINTGSTGATPRAGHIGQILVGAYMVGPATTIVTTNGSVIDQLIIGNVNGGGASEFPAVIKDGYPTIRMGAGSDLRFVDFARAESGTNIDARTRLTYGQTRSFTDDAGAQITITIDGGVINTAGVSTGANSQLDIYTLPIDGSQGVAIARINATVVAGQRNGLVGGANIRVTGVTPGVVSIGRVLVDAAGTQDGNPQPDQVDSSLLFDGSVTEIDVGHIIHSSGALLNITNSSPRGDIVAIDTQAVQNITISGSLGRTQISDPTWTTTLLGPVLGLGARASASAAGSPLGVTAGALNGWNSGINETIPATRPFGGGAGTLESIGSPLDAQLNGAVVRTGHLRQVTVGGQVGDVLVEAGDLINLIANSDTTRATQGAFEGIVGTLYATKIGTVDVGDGLLGAGPGPFAQAGIFADNVIFEVRATRYDGAIISGPIVSGSLGSPVPTRTDLQDPGDTQNELGRTNFVGNENDNPVTYRLHSRGILDVIVNNGQIDGAFIAAQALDDWWRSNISQDLDLFPQVAHVDSITGSGTDLFRSYLGGRSIGTVTLTNGAFDASTVNSNTNIGTFTASEFRNSTRLGAVAEFTPLLITATNNITSIIATSGGDISDMTLNIGGEVTGQIAARDILRSSFNVNIALAAINASRDIISVSVVSGALRSMIAAEDIRTTTLTIAGPIELVQATSGEISQLFIDSTGPDGRLDLLTANGTIQGTINSSGQIGTIRSSTGDVAADITTRQELGRPAPGLTLLDAARDYTGTMLILADLGTLRVGRHIGAFTQQNNTIDVRGNAGTFDARNGQIYSDLYVGQNLTGGVRIGRVQMRAGVDRVSSSDIIAFGSISAIDIVGDFAGRIISRSGGIGAITFTNGSLRTTGSITVDDGSLGTLTFTGGDLLGDVTVDGTIGAIRMITGADGFVSHIGIANKKRNNIAWGDGFRNQLSPDAVHTAGADGAVIRAGGSITTITLDRGSIWESRIIAGESIGTISVGGQVRNDRLSRGRLNQFAAGDSIGDVSVVGYVAGLGVVAGVRSLGDDLSLGGTGTNADTLGEGSIGNVRLNTGGGQTVNSFVAAGIAPDVNGFYNTVDSKTVGGSSSIASVSALSPVSVSAFTDGALGATSAGIVRGGTGLEALETGKIANSAVPNELALTPGVQRTFTTRFGQVFTVLFTGPGQAFWKQNIGRLRLVNTTVASSLVVTTANPSGALKNFKILANSGSAMGTLTVNARLTGASTVYFDNGITSATFGGLINTTGTIGSGGDIGTLTIAGIDQGAVEAGAITTLTVNGGFGATGLTATLRARRIGTATITGDLVGSISSDQTITSFNAGAIRGGGVRSGDSILSVVVGSMTQGRISAGGNLPSVTINGNALESSIYAGADLGVDADFGGTGLAADSVSNGTIGAVVVNGNFRKSDIGAGVLPGPSGFLGFADTVVASGRSSITSVVITGTQTGSLVNSEQYRIASTGSIGTVTVGGQAFTSLNNFRVQPFQGLATPVSVSDLSVSESSRVYTAIIAFNQAIDSSKLADALTVTELRSGGATTITLVRGTDYTVTFDAVKNQALVQFSQAITNRNLPQQAGVAGPGVYQFRLSAATLRGSTFDNTLDGNKDGAAGDDWVQNTIVGDAGDKVTAGNPGTAPSIDFYAAADLDTVFRANPTVAGLVATNVEHTISGVLGDHPDTDSSTFRAGGDVDVYKITLRAGQILRLSQFRGVAQQVFRGVYDASGNRIAGSGPSAAGSSSGQTDPAAGSGLRRLPSEVDTDLFVTTQDQYLVLTTGVYHIVVASQRTHGDISSVNDISNIPPVAGALGAYEFDLMVFDDQNTGFLGDSGSGTGASAAFAPTPSAFFGPDTIEGTSDDLTQFLVGDWTFVRGTETVNGVQRPIVRGSNSLGWTSVRRPAADGTFGSVNDQVTVTMPSSIGLPDSVGRPSEIAPDVDVFRLNNGQPIAPGTKIRATLKLTGDGSDLGLGTAAAGFASQVQFGLFELPSGTGFSDAKLVGSSSEVLAIGGRPATTTTDSRTSYGYDANGDFFMEFIIPGAQGITNDVPSTFALYLQGVIRTDYTLEVVQQGDGSTTAARQNVLLETLGGTIDWLEVGENALTTLAPFDVAALGLTGQIAGQTIQNYVLSNVVNNLNTLFTNANANITVSTDASSFARQRYSTVFIAGNTEPTAFFNNGTFGVSQHRDFMNADDTDQAVIFATSLGSLGITASQSGADRLITALTAAVARRIGELVGLSLETSVGSAQAQQPIMGYDSVSQIPTGTYAFNATTRDLAAQSDNTTTDIWYLGSQNASSLLNKVVARRV